jgi:predicted GIY-YIG superfamily endonuclease
VKYVYILQSLDSEHVYVGITDDLRTRLAKRNAGGVPHTSNFRPWDVKTNIAFRDETQAFAFEQYLKSHPAEHLPRSDYSGRRPAQLTDQTTGKTLPQ